MTSDIGGSAITNYLMTLLNDWGHRFSPNDRGTVSEIKHELTYIAIDYEQEVTNYILSTGHIKTFTLPDGHSIDIGTERFQSPEVLFEPGLLGVEKSGIAELLYKSILNADVDSRKELSMNIILSGGTSLIPGIKERLQKELEVLCPVTLKVRIFASKERNLHAWKGGSILSSLSTFQECWITHEEYQEYGPWFANRKTYSFT